MIRAWCKPSSHVSYNTAPQKISGQPAWFADYYKDGTEAAQDSKLFLGG